MVTLLKLIMVLLAIALVIWIGRSVARSLPKSARDHVAKLARELRVLTGRYTVRDLVAVMLDQLYASAIPSLKRSYLPNHVTFGIHPHDAQRWGGFFPNLEREITLILESRVKSSSRLMLSGPLRIKLQIDQSARPGRPTYAIGTRPGTASANGDHTGQANATATALTETAIAETGLFNTAPYDEREHQQPPAWQLLVTDDHGAGRAVLLYDGVTIGRAENAGVRLHGRGVSREHARISVRPDGELEITDLRSVNGTFVDGSKITTASLADGQQVGFGRTITATVARAV